MFCPVDPAETMPIWFPPSPPASDVGFDAYVEPCAWFLYEELPMTELRLPPVSSAYGSNYAAYLRPDPDSEVNTPSEPSVAFVQQALTAVKAAPQQQTMPPPRILPKTEPSASTVRARSLFEVAGRLSRKDSTIGRRSSELLPAEVGDGAEWAIHEEYALLQAKRQFTDAPSVSHAGHILNWELMEAAVAQATLTYRQKAHCKLHFEHVLGPREEGRPTPHDVVVKKVRAAMMPEEISMSQKKGRLRTNQLYQSEGRLSMCSAITPHCSAVKAAMNKRRAGGGPRLFGSQSLPPVVTGKVDPRHEAYLASFGVSFKSAYLPGQLADIREQRLKEAERLKEKQRLQQGAVESVQQLKGGLLQQHVQQTGSPGIALLTTNTMTPQPVVAGLVTVAQQSVTLPRQLSSNYPFFSSGGQQRSEYRPFPQAQIVRQQAMVKPGPPVSVSLDYMTSATASTLPSFAGSGLVVPQAATSYETAGSAVTTSRYPVGVEQSPQQQQYSVQQAVVRQQGHITRQRIQINPQSTHLGASSVLVSADVLKASVVPSNQAFAVAGGHQYTAPLPRGAMLRAVRPVESDGAAALPTFTSLSSRAPLQQHAGYLPTDESLPQRGTLGRPIGSMHEATVRPPSKPS